MLQSGVAVTGENAGCLFSFMTAVLCAAYEVQFLNRLLHRVMSVVSCTDLSALFTFAAPFICTGFGMQDQTFYKISLLILHPPHCHSLRYAGSLHQACN